MGSSRWTATICTIVIGAATGGCAGGMASPTVTPQDLVALEAERARRPADPEVITRTGIAYYQAGNYQLARDILAMALALDPAAFTAAVHLGLAQEHLGDLSAARAAYAQAGAMRVSKAQRTQVENRLTLLDRRALADDARLAVAREREFAPVAPSPNTIAVLPFRYLGDDESLRPLERGITHLILTDLAKVDRLTLLERERVQAIADELGMGASGQVAPDGAARSGRILGAAHVVHGSVREGSSGGSIQLEANVVNTGDGAIGATGRGSDRLARLFDLEKQVVFELLDQMGIVPTPAERRAIGERPTADLQAFLSFSRGLEAQDHGDFEAARRFFDAAAVRDAGYSDARLRTAEVQRITMALRTTPERLSVASRAPGWTDGVAVRTTRADALGTAVSVVAPSTGDQLERRASDPQRTRNRARVQEGLNRDDPTLIGIIGTILIVVPRP